MMNATVTYPFSLIQTRQAFRACDAAARVAGLGAKCFVDFFKRRSVRNRFIAEHVSESRPSRVVYGLRQAGLGEAGRVHVPHGDVLVIPNDAGREFVVEVPARISDLGVNVGRLTPFSGPLRRRQLRFQSAKVSRVIDLFAVAQGGKVFEAQVNTDGRLNRSAFGFRNFNNDIEKPVSSRIAGEIAAVFYLPFGECAGVEHPKSISRESKGVAFALQISALERNPPKRFFATIPQVRPLLLKARLCVLLTHGIDGAGVNAKLWATAGGKSVQVKTAQPSTPKAQRVLLPVIAEIPDEVDRSRLAIQLASQRFHAVTVGHKHGLIVKENVNG